MTRLVIITWLDSRQADGAWQWLSKYKLCGPYECQSVGWLLQDDDKAKVLAQSMAADGDDVQCAGRKVIPSCAVVKIETLTEVDEPEQMEAAE